MSETINEQYKNSCIELSEIRKLDNLLTQCESSSCENICIDCCENFVDTSTTENSQSSTEGAGLLLDNTEIQQPTTATVDDKLPLSLTDSMHKLESKINISNSSSCNIVDEVVSETKKAACEKTQKQLSEENTVCCRYCDANIKRNFSKHRFFSLDKERNEKLNVCADNSGDIKCVSENALVKSRKHCSFKDATEVTKLKQLSVQSTSIVACDKCENYRNANDMCFLNYVAVSNSSSPTKKKIIPGGHKSVRPTSMSIKSSQNSLKEPHMCSNKITCSKSIDQSAAEKDLTSLRDSKKSKYSPQSLVKKMSIKSHRHPDEQQLDLENLLAENKFGSFHHDIKLPEPVETVC